MTDSTVSVLASLGLSNEEVIDRVVDRICERLLVSVYPDEDGIEHRRDSTFMQRLRERVQSAIDAKVNEIGDKHVLPKVNGMLENLVLQRTNEWGEKKGAPISFVEYLVKRAEDYMTEKVNYEGRNKEESGDAYGWKGTQTRVAHMMGKYLSHHIGEAMKKAVQDVNSTITKGLEETVKLKIAEISRNLKIGVQV